MIWYIEVMLLMFLFGGSNMDTSFQKMDLSLWLLILWWKPHQQFSLSHTCLRFLVFDKESVETGNMLLYNAIENYFKLMIHSSY